MMEDIAQTRMVETAAFIDRYLAETPDLPGGEGQATVREADIREIAASHREFLEFVRWHLSVPLWYSKAQEGPEHFAPGHFDRFMLRMIMKPRVEGEAILEQGEPINFISDGIPAPSASVWGQQDGRVTLPRRHMNVLRSLATREGLTPQKHLPNGHGHASGGHCASDKTLRELTSWNLIEYGKSEDGNRHGYRITDAGRAEL